MNGTVARAFELARTGTCRNVGDIRAQLKKEGYSQIDDHLAGSSLKKQLTAAIALANTSRQLQ